jgi:hypothetical protein
MKYMEQMKRTLSGYFHPFHPFHVSETCEMKRIDQLGHWYVVGRVAGTTRLHLRWQAIY